MRYSNRMATVFATAAFFAAGFGPSIPDVAAGTLSGLVLSRPILPDSDNDIANPGISVRTRSGGVTLVTSPDNPAADPTPVKFVAATQLKPMGGTMTVITTITTQNQHQVCIVSGLNPTTMDGLMVTVINAKETIINRCAGAYSPYCTGNSDVTTRSLSITSPVAATCAGLCRTRGGNAAQCNAMIPASH